MQESIICLPGVGNTPEENINVIAYNDSQTSMRLPSVAIIETTEDILICILLILFPFTLLSGSSSTLFGSRDSLTQPAKWEYLTPLTVNPGYHYAATVYENNIYIAGGELTPDTVWKFDSTFR